MWDGLEDRPQQGVSQTAPPLTPIHHSTTVNTTSFSPVASHTSPLRTWIVKNISHFRLPEFSQPHICGVGCRQAGVGRSLSRLVKADKGHKKL
jgi:hypothetical protein